MDGVNDALFNAAPNVQQAIEKKISSHGQMTSAGPRKSKYIDQKNF